MKAINIWRIGFCIMIFSFFLYSYIDCQNELTSLKIHLPKKKEKLATLQEENKHLQYKIDQYENPTYLMELAQNKHFAHLKHPFVEDIMALPEGMALQTQTEKNIIEDYQVVLPVGAK